MREKGKAETDAGKQAKDTSPEDVGEVHLTHPERVMLRDPPVTKADVWRYYAAVANRMLPGITGRLLSVIRCPSGAEGDCFFQRHPLPGMPDAVRPVQVQGAEGPMEYFAVDDLESLLALVQFGAIELHPWGSRADHPERPDRLVFDLDPAEGLDWALVPAAANELRERLQAVGLESFARTTGGKGLHIVVPIEGRVGWPAAKRFTAGMARAMAGDNPDKYTAKLPKAARHGRIFVDYLRNENASTAVASYSLRNRPRARVAMPLSWAEVGERLDPAAFTLATVPGLVESRSDPWSGLWNLRQKLPRKVSG